MLARTSLHLVPPLVDSDLCGYPLASPSLRDVVQKKLGSAIEGLSGVTGIADETFVFGFTENEHDLNLASLMERARQKSIVFNKEKLQFKCTEVPFFGNTWTPQRAKTDNAAKEAGIQNIQPQKISKT